MRDPAGFALLAKKSSDVGHFVGGWVGEAGYIMRTGVCSRGRGTVFTGETQRGTAGGDRLAVAGRTGQDGPGGRGCSQSDWG